MNLNVFPNTGHHYFTRPLAELLQKSGDELIKLAKQNDPQFLPWSDAYPWLRYRLGTDALNNPIITIAVESNLGHWSRGTLYQVCPCQPDPTLDFFFPYAKDHLKDPTQGHLERIRSFTLGDTNYTVDLQINFMGRWGVPVDVDLIVDLGNTRTAAVLLERPEDGQFPPLSHRLRALRIGPRGMELKAAGPRQGLPKSLAWAGEQNDLAIIDSWFLMHETIFSHLEPGRHDSGEGGEEPKWVIRDAKEHYLAQTGQKAWFLEYSMPHAFIELSPALIGGGKSREGAARIFAAQNLDRDYPFYLSSPKRYVWSRTRRGLTPGTTFWFQVPNRPDPTGAKAFVELCGLIRYFMGTDGNDLNTDGASMEITKPADAALFQNYVHDAPPTYSSSDAVCWFALSLIEAAYRQINTEAYLEGVAHNALRRRLRYVRVTCPSGWTFQERELYLRQWQRAINLFTMTRFENWGEAPAMQGNEDNEPSRPVLCPENLDEAVCSQLPILYAEIQSISGQADKWIELYGHDDKVVVMNLDIGGGTTDLAIIKYTSLARDQVRLKPELLFRDGYPIAGDMVVKRIVELVLIPAWFQASLFGQNPVLAQARADLETLFRQPRNARINQIGDEAATASKRLARIIRLLFIPLANLLLQGLCGPPASGLGGAGRPPRMPGENRRTLNIHECLNAQIVNAQVLADLNRLCARVICHYFPQGGWSLEDKAFSDTAVLNCDLNLVEQSIEEVFAPLFSGLSGLVARNNCDLLIVSGKPSELTRVDELIRREFPLLPQRIVRVKDYPAGSWYPSEFATVDEGRITDAKTCTVVGAALYQDFKCNHTAGFSVILDNEEEPYQRNAYWGVIPMYGPPGAFFNRLLFSPGDYPSKPTDPNRPDCLVKESRPMRLDFGVSHRIGRQLVNYKGVQPAPVYRLFWHRRDPATAGVTVANADVVFRWLSFKGRGDMLEIASVTPVAGGPRIELEDLELELNTLMSDSGEDGAEFWLDDPQLRVTLTGR
jgi:hypothetical protein